MQKKLMRSTRDKKVEGVCGGLAEYFNIDVTIVRFAFVVATLLGGPGLLIYIALWIAMPKDVDVVGYQAPEKNKNEELV